MNNYEIVDEFGYKYPDVLPKVLDKALEIEKINNGIFTIIFVDEKKIQELNREYRNIDRVTDVISFAYNDSGTFDQNGLNVLGEIFVCIPRMKEQAKEYGHSETREICFLCVHGLLHLLGYDHQTEDEEKVMFGRQEDVLNEFIETKRQKTIG